MCDYLWAGAYYIEALQMEDTVDDCLAVGWTLPDGTMERPIPGTRLSTADEATDNRASNR
jgi:hypothetical protein